MKRVKDSVKIAALAEIINLGRISSSEYQVATTFEGRETLISACQISRHDDDVGELFYVCGCGAVVEVGGREVKNACDTYEKEAFCDIRKMVMVCHGSTRKYCVLSHLRKCD